MTPTLLRDDTGVPYPHRVALAFRHDIGGFRSLIARVTGAPCHVALVFTFPSGPRTVIEADGHAVREIDAEKRFRVGQWTMVPVPVAPIDVAAGYRFARAQIGKPYDWFGVLFAWWAGRRAGLRFDSFFCSKLAAATLRAMRVDIQPARAAAWVPRTLFDWCAVWRQ